MRNPRRPGKGVGALPIELSADDLARTVAAVPAGSAGGERYSAARMRSVYVGVGQRIRSYDDRTCHRLAKPDARS
jgi:hypothetical protein